MLGVSFQIKITSALTVFGFYKYAVLLCLILLLGTRSKDVDAQGVKIDENQNTVTTVDASAILELASTNRGLLLPRIQDTNNVSNPVAGLLVYQLKDNKLYFHNGSRWQSTSTDN